jgi:hypothetical protein
MTADNIGSGRSRKRTVFELFLERPDGFFRGDIDPEHFVYGDVFKIRRRLSLTICIALVRALGHN